MSGIARSARVLTAIAALLAAITFPLAGFAAGLPAPTVSKHFETKGAGFLLDTRARAVRYFLHVEVRNGFGKTVRVRVLFDNPANATRPLLVEQRLGQRQSSITVESGSVRGLRNNRVYDVTVVAIDPSSGAELTRHVQPIYFQASPQILMWWNGQ